MKWYFYMLHQYINSHHRLFNSESNHVSQIHKIMFELRIISLCRYDRVCFLSNKQQINLLTFSYTHGDRNVAFHYIALTFDQYAWLGEFSPQPAFRNCQGLHFRKNETRLWRIAINKRVFVYFFALLNNLFVLQIHEGCNFS